MLYNKYSATGRRRKGLRVIWSIKSVALRSSDSHCIIRNLQSFSIFPQLKAVRNPCLISILPELRSGIDRQRESPLIRQITLLSHLRQKHDEASGRFCNRVLLPRTVNEKEQDTGAVERGAFVRPASNPEVARKNRPAALGVQCADI